MEKKLAAITPLIMCLLTVIVLISTYAPHVSAMKDGGVTDIPEDMRYEYLYPEGEPDTSYLSNVDMITEETEDGYISISVRVHEKLKKAVLECLEETNEICTIEGAGGSDIGTDISLVISGCNPEDVEEIWESHGFYIVHEAGDLVVFSYLP